MNPSQKRIMYSIVLFVLFWNAQYLIEYLDGFYLIFMLVFFVSVMILIVIAFFQLFKYLKDEKKDRYRLLNICLIFFVAILFFCKPTGLYDFDKLEGANILFIQYKGVANCTTSFRLKKNQRFKETSICFGIEHSWGHYEISEDTIKLKFDNRDKVSGFLILKTDEENKNRGMAYYHTHGEYRTALPMIIKELKINELNKMK